MPVNEKLTIAQVKEKKLELEAAILDLVREFEEETGVRLSYMDFQRENLNRKSSAPVELVDPYEPGPIINVDARMNLDLIY